MKKILMTVTFMVFGLVMATAIISCRKSEQPDPEAVYSGTFTVKYQTAIPEQPVVSHSGATTLTLSGGKYSCTGNKDRIPAGGSGTYSIKGDKIIFADQNFWTADFDWRLILNGIYDYTIDGTKIKISRADEYASYEYDLKKVD